MKPWEYKQGYEVDNESEHEDNDDYTAFLNFLQSRQRVIDEPEEELAGKYNWRERAAKFDQHKAITTINKSELLNKRQHKQELLVFLEEQKQQAERTHNVAARIQRVVDNRLERAELRGEEIPLELIPAFMRASTVVSEESRKSWAASLGVTRLLEHIDTSIKDDDVETVTQVEVKEVEAVSAEVDYNEVDIPCDE